MNAKTLLCFIILLLGCTGQFASDIYAPSLSFIAHDLKTSISSVQLSMAIYMFGLAASQLFYGPLSEGLGRKKPLIIGLSIFLGGSFIALFAPHISFLILGRFIQGCGAGACSTMWRSIFRDTFEGAELAKYGAYLSIFVAFIIPAAPVLGGFFQHYFNWRISFLFLILYATVSLYFTVVKLNETSQYHHPEKLKLKFIKESFQHILVHRIFLSYTLCTFLCYGAFFSWFTLGPVLLIKMIGISPLTFGWITFFGGGLATALGGWVNGKFVTQWGTHNMLRIGFAIMFVSGVLLIIGNLIWGMQLLAIIIPMLLFYFGVTFIWPSAFASAFAPFGKIAGYAGALYGCIQISGAAFLGTITAYLPHQNQIPLALVFMSTAILAWSVLEKANYS